MKALYILFKQNRLLNISLAIAAILFFAVVYLAVIHTAYSNERAIAGKSLIGSNNYNITILDKTPSTGDLYKFTEALKKEKGMTVYNASTVDVFIKDFSGAQEFMPPKTKIDGAYTPVFGLQVNQIAYKLNAMEMDAGSFFSKKDFENYKGKGVMPVVLGSDFYPLYNINDKVHLRVFGQPIEAEIKGFLKADQKIVTSALPQLSAAHQVLIPSQKYSKVPNAEDAYANQALLASANTMLVTSASKIGIRDMLRDVSKEADYWNFAIGGAGGLTVNLYNTILKVNTTLVYSLLTLGLIFMVFFIIFIQPIRNKHNKGLFTILTNSGMNRSAIKKYVLLEAAIIIGIAILLPIIPFIVISQLSIKALILYLPIALVIGVALVMLIMKKTVIEMRNEHV